MILKNPKFITSMARGGPFSGDHLPKTVVVGRSNVGKSSMINCLCNRSGMARVSQTPGKTRLVNIFNIDGEFILCDLPGYGFAKVSESERLSWGRMVEDFLRRTQGIQLILHLLDIRHEPSREDIQMAAWLKHYDIPYLTVLTKADKLSKAQRSRIMPVIGRNIAAQPWEMLPFSSKDRTGRDEVIHAIREAMGLAEPVPRKNTDGLSTSESGKNADLEERQNEGIE